MRAESLPENAIEARGLDKTYRGDRRSKPTHALKAIDLKIPRGSFFGLLGPNGAGKSTFINILAGVVNKTGGAARIWGYDIDESPRNARGAIGIVPQEIVADPFFTPFETLELMAGFYGVPKGERRTMEILTALGLAEKRNAYTRALSGGMKRRLLVGKALVHNPPVLVLDEPTAGVDVELRRLLWDYIKALHARGVTIVLTTHYLEEAQELCDTIAIVNHGAVIACEPTGQILRRLDHRTLVVHGERPISATPASFADMQTQLRADGALAITYRSGQISFEQLLERVKAAGISIRDLAVQEPDLEDVFVALTSTPRE
ncbi:MAG TPA: ABC transporter ATP-binding protein [Caulobacterales bacterium]|nr:ABC transporter ATP-binding protein [Caulobacterales bacterium]